MLRFPSLPILLASSFPVCGFAATVTFDFEASNNTATITGTGVSSNSLVEGGTENPGATAVYARLTSTTGLPADTTMVRGYLPDDVSSSASSVSTSASYVEFTLTPEAGKTLDFSAANVAFILGAATSHSSGNIVSTARVGYRVNSGTWAVLGSSSYTSTAVFGSADPNWASTTGYTTTASYDVSQTLVDIPLASSITGLNEGDTVTFRIAIADNSTVNNITTSANVKSLYLDNISVSGVNAVPEPSALLLSGLGMGALILRRRKI